MPTPARSRLWVAWHVGAFTTCMLTAVDKVQRGKGGNDDDDGLHEPPPMRVQIEHQHFVVIEVFH